MACAWAAIDGMDGPDELASPYPETDERLLGMIREHVGLPFEFLKKIGVPEIGCFVRDSEKDAIPQIACCGGSMK